MDAESLEAIERIVVAKTFATIHIKRLDLQPKLLHILHSVILASSTIPGARQGKSKVDATLAIAALDPSGSSQSNIVDEVASKKLPTTNIDPLLTQTLIDGISEPSNRPILQHWLDFVLTTIPQFSQSLHHLTYPLIERICQQLADALEEVDKVASEGFRGRRDVSPIMTDAEFVMLLHALERLVLQGLSKNDSLPGEVFDEQAPTTTMDKESTGLLGLVSNVFSPDGSSVFSGDNLSVGQVFWLFRNTLTNHF